MITLADFFMIGYSTAHEVIDETCEMLWNYLSPMYMKPPTNDDWKNIAKDYFEKWNMPNCVGSLDGRHCSLIKPAKSGSLHYCYKKFYSNVLLALADANYNFIAVDVGGYGSQSDGGIFKECAFGKKFDLKQMEVPEDEMISNYNLKFPYFILGDATFPLKVYIMKPYPGKFLNKKERIFDYCFSRVRRVVENAFGILVTRWRILWSKMNVSADLADKIICAAVVLHNFANKTQIREKTTNLMYTPNNYTDSYDEFGNLIPEAWRNEILNDFNPVIENNRGLTNYVRKLRDELAD